MSGADVPFAELLGHQSRGGCTGGVAHLGEDDGARLDSARVAEGLKRGHAVQPLVFFVFGLPQPNPRLQPAFAA